MAIVIRGCCELLGYLEESKESTKDKRNERYDECDKQ